MVKRSLETDELDNSFKNGGRPTHTNVSQNTLHNDQYQFEDEFEDEFESENELTNEDKQQYQEEPEDEFEEKTHILQEAFIPGRHKLHPDEILQPDESAYEMLHDIEPPWPCLSFDILKDNLGDGRARKLYPATVYAVAGTQAAQGYEQDNELMVMKMSKLSRLDKTEDSGSENDRDEDEEEDSEEGSVPILETKTIGLKSCTNRIRVHQRMESGPLGTSTTTSATMTESGQVFLHDISPHISSFDVPGQSITPEHSRPLHVIKSHGNVEGFALDWSPVPTQRRLLTGDCSGKIFLTSEREGGVWSTALSPFLSHKNSVEEIQWSPSENNVFASASSDGTVKIWDCRAKGRKPAISMQISTSDVNVLSWSRLTSHLLASGADDGQWAVWDLRQWKNACAETPRPVAAFNFHKEQITSLEWHPFDDSVVAVAAGDNMLTLWDLAVELDDEDSRNTAGVQDMPPQLLFVHYMEQIKECHWHSQIPGCIMATGNTGFGLFKTISI